MPECTFNIKLGSECHRNFKQWKSESSISLEKKLFGSKIRRTTSKKKKEDWFTYNALNVVDLGLYSIEFQFDSISAHISCRSKYIITIIIFVKYFGFSPVPDSIQQHTSNPFGDGGPDQIANNPKKKILHSMFYHNPTKSHPILQLNWIWTCMRFCGALVVISAAWNLKHTVSLNLFTNNKFYRSIFQQ